MQRDMDLIRSIILQIEGGKAVFETLSDESSEILGVQGKGLSSADADQMEHHLGLVEDAGFVEFERAGAGTWYAGGLTWAGHDFADSVRDEEIWKKTKAGATAAGGFTVDLLKALAKGFVKKQIEDRTGITLDL